MFFKATKCYQKYKSLKSDYIHLLVSTIVFLAIKNSTQYQKYFSTIFSWTKEKNSTQGLAFHIDSMTLV